LGRTDCSWFAYHNGALEAGVLVLLIAGSFCLSWRNRIYGTGLASGFVFVIPAIAVQVWKLVKDLWQAGAYISNFHPGNIAVNEKLPEVQHGVLWVDFKNTDWVALRYSQSAHNAIIELAEKLLPWVRLFSSKEYFAVLRKLALRVLVFGQKHVDALAFPSEAEFQEDCLQGLLEEHRHCVSFPNARLSVSPQQQLAPLGSSTVWPPPPPWLVFSPQ
jgi:hypothetical protein